MPLPVESKLLLVIFLLIGMEKKVFASPIAAYQVPGAVLIYSGDGTTSGVAAYNTVACSKIHLLQRPAR